MTLTADLDHEVARLLAHIDRNAARRFLVNPEPPTGFADFPFEHDAPGESPEAVDGDRA